MRYHDITYCILESKYCCLSFWIMFLGNLVFLKDLYSEQESCRCSILIHSCKDQCMCIKDTLFPNEPARRVSNTESRFLPIVGQTDFNMITHCQNSFMPLTAIVLSQATQHCSANCGFQCFHSRSIIFDPFLQCSLRWLIVNCLIYDPPFSFCQQYRELDASEMTFLCKLLKDFQHVDLGTMEMTSKYHVKAAVI